MSIQPVNKAAEHLINLTPVLEREGEKVVDAYKGEGWGRGTITSSLKDWVEYCMSQSILCNYFEVCTKFSSIQ